MNGHFATQIGRERTDDLLARADRHRLMQQVRREEDTDPWRPTSLGKLLYRRAFAAVALSMLVLLATASLALAGPAGPQRDPGAGAPIRGSSRSATAEAGLDWGRVAFASGAMFSFLVVLAYGTYVARRRESGGLTRGTVL